MEPVLMKRPTGIGFIQGSLNKSWAKHMDRLLTSGGKSSTSSIIGQTTYAFVGDAVAYQNQARTMDFVMSRWALAMALWVPLGVIPGQYAGRRGAFLALASLSAFTAVLMGTVPTAPETGGLRGSARPDRRVGP